MGETSNRLSPALFRRNALVTVVFIIAFGLMRAFPRYYMSPWPGPMVLLLCCFFWANLPLYKAGNRLSPIILSILEVPIVGILVSALAVQLGDFISAQQYRAQGLQFVNGCNGAAANYAYFERQRIDEYIKELSDSKSTNTTVLAQLQSARIIAVEKEKILNADCAKRGHRDSHPWKTNWSGIKNTLTAAEEVIYNR